MESSDSNVFNRIKKLEPDTGTAYKILGYLLMQEGSAQQMINLDMSSDAVLQEVVSKVKENLQAFKNSTLLLEEHNPARDTPDAAMNNLYYSAYPNSQPEKQTQLMALDDQMRFSGDFTTTKICRYYNKGTCKHGSNCRYVHAYYPGSFPQIFQNEARGLERLGMEIIDLLKSIRGGPPISIALLPTYYFERYGKVLQADGYLTESQRHGKPGCNLTKLLARLSNSICLIGRPHGQHDLILAEDAWKYMETRCEKNDPGPIVIGSKQIYLTFPPDSTFTEDDVSNYFSTFGEVGDVRIPCQKLRMFGFVSFASAETVKIVLAKRNPHYVSNSRVLVKPYRETSNKVDRKVQFSGYYSPSYLERDSEYISTPSRAEVSKMLLRNQPMESLDQTLELATRCLAGLQLATKPSQSYFSYGVTEDHTKLWAADRFNELYALHKEPNMISNIKTNSNENEQGNVEALSLPDSMDAYNLPESPFGY